MADKKMKGKLVEYCDEDSQATASSSNPTAVEENLAGEAPDTDPQSLRNRQSISPTGEEVEPERKIPRYASSSSDSTLPDPDFPVNQDNTPETTTSPAFFEIPPADSLTDLISHKLVPVIESWLKSHIRTFAPRNTSSIPGVGNLLRPPRPLRRPRPPRPPGSKPSLELGHHQRAHSSAAGSGSQSPIPNVGSQLGVEDPSSAQQQRMQQAPPPGGVVHPYYAFVSRIPKLEAELNYLKGSIDEVRSILGDVTDGLLLEVEHCQHRVSKLEAEVKNLKSSNSGLQAELDDSKLEAELGKSSEGQVATDDKSFSSAVQIMSIPSVDAEVPFDLRARSGPGSTSGKDDESEGPVTIAAGDGLSAANTDRNKATTESDESQDEKKNVDASQDDNFQ